MKLKITLNKSQTEDLDLWNWAGKNNVSALVPNLVFMKAANMESIARCLFFCLSCTGCSIWIVTKEMSAMIMFLVSDTFPFRFMPETCVHFDFYNIFFLNLSKSPPMIWGIFQIFNFSKKWKIPLWKIRKKFYSKNQNVHTFPA